MRLNEHYTLQEGLQYGMTGCDNRHGQMHVKWFTHTLSVSSRDALQPDGRWLPRRCAMGDPGSPKEALYELVSAFAPFASALYYATVPAKPRPWRLTFWAGLRRHFPSLTTPVYFLCGQ